MLASMPERVALGALYLAQPGNGVVDPQNQTRADCGGDEALSIKACYGSTCKDGKQETPSSKRGESAECDVSQYSCVAPAVELACDEAGKKAESEPSYDGHGPLSEDV